MKLLQFLEGLSKAFFVALKDLASAGVRLERAILGVIADLVLVVYFPRYILFVLAIAVVLFYFKLWLFLGLYVLILIIVMVRFFRFNEIKVQQGDYKQLREMIIRILRWPFRALVSVALLYVSWYFIPTLTSTSSISHPSSVAPSAISVEIKEYNERGDIRFARENGSVYQPPWYKFLEKNPRKERITFVDCASIDSDKHCWLKIGELTAGYSYNIHIPYASHYSVEKIRIPIETGISISEWERKTGLRIDRSQLPNKDCGFGALVYKIGETTTFCRKSSQIKPIIWLKGTGNIELFVGLNVPKGTATESNESVNKIFSSFLPGNKGENNFYVSIGILQRNLK
jgi:hypothetical protein